MTVYNPLLVESFGHGSLTWLLSYGWTVSGTTLTTTVKHQTSSGAGSGYSAAMGSGNALYSPLVATTGRYLHIVVNSPTVTGTSNLYFFRLGAANCAITCNQGTVRLYRGNAATLLATAASTISTATNHLWVCDVVAKDLGQMRLYVDRSATPLVETAAGLTTDCQQTATADVDQIVGSHSSTSTTYWMDVVWFPAADGLPTFECYGQWQYPTGNGVVTFTPTTPPNWACVDDACVTADYVSRTSAGTDYLTYPALSTTPIGSSAITIVAVAQHLYGTAEGAITTAANTVSSGAVTGSGTLRTLSAGGTYSGLQDYFTSDPNTSAAWTVTGLNTASFGYTVA